LQKKSLSIESSTNISTKLTQERKKYNIKIATTLIKL